MGQKQLWIGIGIAVSIGIVLGVIFWPRPDDTSENGIQIATPTPPDDEHLYVGSIRCAECHQDLSHSFAQHPMGRSTRPMTPKALAERTGGTMPSFTAGPFTYSVEVQDGKVMHREVMKNSKGEVLTDVAVPIDYIVGSGIRGESYITNRDGLLFQSPISYFTQKDRWDLSPGYSATQETKFERRILDACITCHVGRLNVDDRSRKDAFSAEPFLESAISCERCHGPGKKHIEKYETNANGDDPYIINPAKLKPDLRDSLCYQCHLSGDAIRFPRHGRKPYDYRPGDPFEKIFAVLLPVSEAKEETQAVSHVQQMMASKCYQESNRVLSCISCHDPHSLPAPVQKAEFYRSRCMKCHAENDDSCSVPLNERSQPPANNSCIHCHMSQRSASNVAHTSQTDHRILRTPDQIPQFFQKSDEKHVRFFLDSKKAMPDWEQRLMRALALNREGITANSEEMLEEAHALLKSLQKMLPESGKILKTIVSIDLLLNQRSDGREQLEQLVEREPNDEDALQLLSRLCALEGDYSASVKYQQRLVKLNPWDSLLRLSLAKMHAGLSDWDSAIEQATKGLEINPSHMELRAALVKYYEKSGQSEKVGEQRKLLDAIEKRLFGF